MNVESILRSLPTEEKIFRNQKRVSVLKAVDCIMELSKHKMDSNSIKKELQLLVDSYKLVRVQEKGEKVDLAISKRLNPSDIYMWTESKKEYMNLVVAFLAIGLVFFLAMFQIWPRWLRNLVGYSSYLVMGIIGFFIVAAFIRVVVFGITYYTHSPGIWLLPNLFEECGVIESFIPAYCWANEDVKPKKKEE